MSLIKNRKVFLSCFFRFLSVFLICTMLFFSNCRKTDAAFLADDLAIPLVAGGTVLGPGAIVVLGVCAAVGIALCNEDVRDFITDCGTYCYDELDKIIATYDESLNGINAELTPSLVEKVLEFAKSKEGTSIIKNFNPSIVGDFYVLPIIPSSTYKKLYTFTLTSNSVCYVYSGDSLFTYIDSLQSGSNVIYVTGFDGWFRLGWNSPGFNSNINLYHESQSSSSYTLRVPFSNVEDLLSDSSISESFTYPDITKDGCKSIDEYNDKYKEYTGTNSVCADLTKLGGLALDSSVDDVCTALEGTLPVYSDDVIGTSDIPGISIENDGVKVDNPPDTSVKDETGVLGSILEWLRGLLLDLFKFLEGLFDKLISALKDLLVFLFVPTLSIADTKQLFLDRLSVPVFSAPGDSLNKEPLTFTFPVVVPGVNSTEVVVTLDQPWFPFIREIILGFISYLLVLFAYKKISSLSGGDD